MGCWTKRMLNKEEYKGLFKLFLQWSNLAAFVCLLALGAFLSPFVQPLPADAAYTAGGYIYNTDSGTVVRNQGYSSALNNDITPPGSFSLSYFKPGKKVGVDTQFGIVGDSSTRIVRAIYGDTLSIDSAGKIVYILGTNDGVYDTVYLTYDTAAKVGETRTFILSFTNHANTADTLGLIVDTAWYKQQLDTLGTFSYQFFNKSGDTITRVLYAPQEDTGRVGLMANEFGTAVLRIFTKGTSPGDTLLVAVRAYANNTTGRFPGTPSAEVNAYRGFNGVRYGGSGNAAAYIQVLISGPVVRYAKTDTVFSPVALVGGATDTQNFIPGSLVVYTVWFDNDGNDTGDTIYIEDWIDTRFLRFDSQGLSSQIGNATQIAAAGTYVINRYGSIFTDSAMPTFATTGWNVQIQYYNAAGGLSDLKTAPSPDAVGRIRWVISRAGGVTAPNNNDDPGKVESAPIAPTAGADVDVGFVRFSVIIR